MSVSLQSLPKLTIGLVVNPVAGLGGSVGLKGSDGQVIQREAIARGATPHATRQAARTLTKLRTLLDDRFDLLTAPAMMGEDAAREAHVHAEVVQAASEPTTLLSSTAKDTQDAVRFFDALGVDLILFVGGDGTARDVHEALAQQASDRTVLGIPAGVKMQSGIFARSSQDAAVIVRDWYASSMQKELGEVADIDEEARRNGVLASNLYGYLHVPRTRRPLQGGKIGSATSAQFIEGIAMECISQIDPDAMCLLGPGSTVQAVSELLHGDSSLLGIDVAHQGEIIAVDLSSRQLNEITQGKRLQLVLSPVGGQGFLFGRGNQQLDSELLSRVEREDLFIVCTEEKLAQLGGGPLYIDVPELEMVERFTGYKKVITGGHQTASIRVDDAKNVSA